MDAKEQIKSLMRAVQNGEEGSGKKLREVIDKYLEDRNLETEFEVPDEFIVHKFEPMEVSSQQEKLYEDDVLVLTRDMTDEATLTEAYRVWVK